MNKICLYEASINTIPEDTLAFSMVERGSDLYFKLIMENYINFMTINSDFKDEVILRFHNYVNWESVDLFSSFFIPRDIYQHFGEKISLIHQLIDGGYSLMTFYDRYYISKFEGEHFSHTMAINGYDDENKLLLCKDYSGNKFIDVTIPYDEYFNSVENYDFFSIARLGLFGIKINPHWQPINLLKTRMELMTFIQNDINVKNNIGIGIFRTLINNLKKSFWDEKLENPDLYRWYQNACFLREGAALMSERLKYLLKISEESPLKFTAIDDALQKHSKILYGIAAKSYMKGQTNQQTYMKLFEMLNQIASDYKEIVLACLKILDYLV